MSQIRIKRAVWEKLTKAQRIRVSITPEHVRLGQPATQGTDCVFDHPRIAPADIQAVKDLIRSFNRPSMAKKQGK